MTKKSWQEIPFLVKSTMANSLEVRVPFLDKQFLALAMGMAPAHKRPRPEPGQNGGRPVEKWVLRKAFQDEVGQRSGRRGER